MVSIPAMISSLAQCIHNTCLLHVRLVDNDIHHKTDRMRSLGRSIRHIDQVVPQIAIIINDLYCTMHRFKRWLMTLLLVESNHFVKSRSTSFLQFFHEQHIYTAALFVLAKANNDSLLAHFGHQFPTSVALPRPGAPVTSKVLVRCCSGADTTRLPNMSVCIYIHLLIDCIIHCRRI